MGIALTTGTADVEGDANLGRGIGARGEFREAEKLGNVLEREMEGGVECAGLILFGWKTARCNETECPDVELREADGGREWVVIGNLSGTERSWRSSGGVVSRRFSSTEVGVIGGEEDEGAVSVVNDDALDRSAVS